MADKKKSFVTKAKIFIILTILYFSMCGVVSCFFYFLVDVRLKKNSIYV